jgi:hypothetical protein
MRVMIIATIKWRGDLNSITIGKHMGTDALPSHSPVTMKHKGLHHESSGAGQNSDHYQWPVFS